MATVKQGGNINYFVFILHVTIDNDIISSSWETVDEMKNTVTLNWHIASRSV